MRFYVEFSLSLVLFVTASNQAEINNLSVAFFLKGVVSLFSGLGKGGFTTRCCTKWGEGHIVHVRFFLFPEMYEKH